MNRPLAIALAVAGAVLLFVGYNATFVVHQWEQALVLRFGKPQRLVEAPGLNFKLPFDFIENVVRFDRRVLNFDAPADEVPTVDQKQVIVDAFARYRITEPLLFFQRVRDENGAQAQLRPMISSNLRRALGEVPMSLILTAQRADLMDRVTTAVNDQAISFGIEVIDVRMKRVDLPEENSQAIFRRMQTQREQEARRFRAEGARDAQTIRAEADKQQVVIIADALRKAEILRGEGDATATGIYNDAYGRDPAFFDFYRSMQALRAGLPSETTTYVGPPSGDFFRFFGDVSGQRGRESPGQGPGSQAESAPPSDNGASGGESGSQQ